MRRPGVSRLAPSPSGPLHLGNGCTFMVNWALARRNGWRLPLRIDDLDLPRVRPGAEASIRGTLAWLGIDFDGECERPSRRGPAYEASMTTLAAKGFVFESPHSRAEVRAASGACPETTASASADHDDGGDDPDATPASAPHASSARPFPRVLRPRDSSAWRFTNRAINHRFRVPDSPERVEDLVQGGRDIDLGRSMGDFIVWSKAGVAGYQLAVALDDSDEGVTDVVRGADLLPSAAAQQCILRALDRPVPRWWHLPLVVDAAGRRLSKREGDLSLGSLQARGVAPERVIGLFGHWVGLEAPLREMNAAAFRDACDPERLRAWARMAPPRLDARALGWLGVEADRSSPAAAP